MKKNNLQKIFYLIFGIYWTLFYGSNNLKAQIQRSTTTRASAVGVASATVVGGAINLSGAAQNAEFVDDISLDVDRSSLTSNSVSKKRVINTITSRPNTGVNISYGQVALSKQNEVENKMGYATVNLKNENGNVLKVKVKLSKTVLNFDKDGRSELEVESEFFPNKQQPNGTYRGVYYIVMSY